MPQQDVTYRDNRTPERKLEVELVELRNPIGRQVQGIIRHPGHEHDGRQYACDLGTFRKVWGGG